MKLARRVFALSVLAFGLVVSVTACSDAKRVALAEQAFPPVGQFVDVNGSRVHYVRKGTGPDVVLLHGAGGNLRDFTFDLMDRLTDNYTVTAFDRPGLGYTDRVPGITERAFATEGESPMQQAELLRNASALLGINDPIVVGHSFGGAVAMAWATSDLDMSSPASASAVVSLAGVSMPWPGDISSYYRINGSALGGAVSVPLISALVSDGYVENVIASTFAPQAAPTGYTDHIGAPLTLRNQSLRANVRQVNKLRPQVVEMAKRYPRLTLPIEIVHGTEDTVVPVTVHADELIKIVPSARLARLDGVGHMPHHANPAEAVAAIDRAAARAGLR